MRYLVYAYEQYRDKRAGVPIGCSLTREGARQIILDYRRFGMLGAFCDIVTERAK